LTVDGPDAAWPAPRLALGSYGGAAAVGFVLMQLLIWRGGPGWLAPVSSGAYILALLAWTGSWNRPARVALAVVAGAAGFFCGAVVAILVAQWMSRGPAV
jgi:hypothetical protein